MPEEVIERLYRGETLPPLIDELRDLYSFTPDDEREAWQAISDHEDFKLFNLPPEQGGLEDQPESWYLGVKTVERAKNWAEAIRQAQRDVDSSLSGDPEHRDQNRVTEASNELAKLEARHKKALESMRGERQEAL